MPVPGCIGTDSTPTDYCINPNLEPPTPAPLEPATSAPLEPPTSVPELKSYVGTPPTEVMPLGVCEGDGDNDSMCKDGLIGYQRVGNVPVPGCVGTESTPTA